MLNKIIYFFCYSILLNQCCSLQAENPTANNTSIKWQTNYDEAIKQAKENNKPLVLFFTGSDWCTWCTKLEEEVLSTSDFALAAGNKFIFLKVDFPLYTTQDPNLKAQNSKLKQQFDIRGYPTVIIYDAQQNKQIGNTGYRRGGGKSYADFILKMVNDNATYNQKLGSLDKGILSGSELKQLYELAKKNKFTSDANLIVRQGIKSDKSLFFLTERYRQLANQGQIHSTEAQNIKQQLLASDIHNDNLIPYHVAVIEFETYLDQMSKENYTAELAVMPLITYIEKFGRHDNENLWRLEMIISQVYLDKNQLSSALKHAQLSFDAAPPSVKTEISRAIKSISSQIDASSIISIAH